MENAVRSNLFHVLILLPLTLGLVARRPGQFHFMPQGSSFPRNG